MKIVAIILLVLFTGCSTSSSYSDRHDELKSMGYSGRHDEILKSMGY